MHRPRWFLGVEGLALARVSPASCTCSGGALLALRLRPPAPTARIVPRVWGSDADARADRERGSSSRDYLTRRPLTSSSPAITIEVSMSRTAKKLPPIHPGEVLRTEFLAPLSLSQRRLAKGLS